MRFEEVVRALGASNALDALDMQEQELEQTSQRLLLQIRERELEMKSYIDKKRKKRIRDQFRDVYSNARSLLNLPAIDTSKQQIHSRPDVSGSGGPRAVLAYYASISNICSSPHGRDESEPPSIPRVVDCPNQQGQDAKNLPAVISFLATRLAAGTQIIVTFEQGVADKFDHQVELLEPYGLLGDDEFASVSGQLDDLIAQMNAALIQPRQIISTLS